MYLSESANHTKYYETIKEKNLNNSEVELVAKESLREIKGIELIFTRFEILSDNMRNSKVFSMVKNQFHSKRSGDLVVVNKPYYETAGFRYTLDQGSHHETYASFNTHIPIIFCATILIIFSEKMNNKTLIKKYC